MVKQERNFHCAVCGKTYADPAAAQDHARKHTGGGRGALATVAPQPTGTAGVQQTTPPITTVGNIGTAHPPSSSQRAPPNPLVGSSPKRPKTSREKLSCPWCPHLKKFRTTANLKWHRKTFHATIYKCSACPAEFGKDKMWKHMRDVHGATRRRRTMNRLRKTHANRPNTRKQTIPGGPSTELPYDEEQLSSEDEESQSSDDEERPSLKNEGQSPSENEQRLFPDTWGKPFTQGHRLSFKCDLCLESFLTTETLEMHTRFAHRWMCGYCRDKPLFLSFSLWREHRVTIHELV